MESVEARFLVRSRRQQVQSMSDPLRENGPVLLVPAAWGVVGAAHAGAVAERTLLIAHIIMAVILFVFAVASWKEMNEEVLRVWRSVLVVGFFFTVGGAVGLAGAPVLPERVPLAVSLYGWMLAPAAGLAYTARESDAPYAYAVGAVLSVVGAGVYAATVTASVVYVSQPALVAITLVGVGQTVGIADAVYRY